MNISTAFPGLRRQFRLLDLAAGCLAAERSRWALWIPVAFGAGIGVYFALPAEPAVWSGALAVLVAAGLVTAARWRGLAQLLAWAVLIAALGFCVAQFRTRVVAAPVLAKATRPLMVTGTVERSEPQGGHVRLWLTALSITRLPVDATPDRVRIRIAGADSGIRPGDRVRVRAVLYPPAGPAAPGAFDFARRAWFERLGGVGYAVSRVAIVDPVAETGFAARLQRLRQAVTRRVLTALPGPAGGVAAALMTGERGAVPQDVLDAMRDSGLAHLLAISGLHIGLVGGLLFFGLRLFLATCGTLALRFPIKKWAAFAALAGSLCYLLISGATVPTQRAFLMLSLVMLAVMIDRAAISMHLVAWAAMVVLLIAPESLLSVSFQMSFAAVIALVAAYEAPAVRRLRRAAPAGLARRAGLYLAAVLLSTVVAGLATAPFALYHFNRFALYGVLANLIAVPLTALLIMPCAVAAFLLMPLGLEAWALHPMAYGIDGVIAVAHWVQGLSGAVVRLPATDAWGVVLIALGGLWLCLWQTPRWRHIGLGAVAAGAAVAAWSPPPPDILVAEAGRAVAVRNAAGGLTFLAGGKGFVADSWRRRSGSAEAAAGRDPRLRCDPLGCVYRHPGGRMIAYVRKLAALPDDCRPGSIVISVVPVRPWRCRGASLVVDRFALWRKGPHAVWLVGDMVNIDTVAAHAGGRPWSRYPRRPRRSRALPQ